MTSKARVQAALNHRTPDRVPIDLGSSSVTGMHVSCVAALRDWFGLEKRPVKVHDTFQMLGWLDEDLRAALGVDVEGVMRRKNPFGVMNEDWTEWRAPLGDGYLDVLVPAKFRTTVDAAGDVLAYPVGDPSAAPSGRMPRGGYFFDAISRQQPLDEDRLNPEDNLEEFGPPSDDDVAWFAARACAAQSRQRALMASFGGTAFGDIAQVPGIALKHPKGIRDVAEWYVSTRSRRHYIHAVFERQAEIAVARLARIASVIGNAVDIAYICGTDFGTQTSAFCSVDTFRELWLPYYVRVNGWIHENTGWKTFKHSCGSVVRFIDSFVECGFDILNPVQCSAAGMDPVALKERYGDRIVFWGGGVDTQKTLPFGTPVEVRVQVLERCETFARGGGFVFASIHNVQAGTPVENIIAMVNAVHEFNGVTART